MIAQFQFQQETLGLLNSYQPKKLPGAVARLSSERLVKSPPGQSCHLTEFTNPNTPMVALQHEVDASANSWMSDLNSIWQLRLEIKQVSDWQGDLLSQDAQLWV